MSTRYRGRQHARHGERGVTIFIVAAAMVSLLAMVALAVDVIALYAARSEAQRGADSAALAAAKMLVDMGVTADPSNAALQSTAQTVATKVAQDVATQIAIAARQVQASDVTVTFPNGGNAAQFGINPTVAVTVNRPNLPTFFSRIWSRAALSVSATATAEGFNPSNSSAITGTAGLPVVARCVKPFLLPNCDPNPAATGTACGTNATFFDPTTGAITRPGQYPAGIIGETFTVMSNCTGPGCTPGTPKPNLYYPALMPPAASGNACPSTCGGGTAFEGDIECCNPSPLSCGTTATPPTTYQLQLDNTVFPDGHFGPAQSGVECLIHQNPGSGQDTLNGGMSAGGTVSGAALNYPLQIQVGGNHPLQGTPSLSTGDYITTSDSLVTVPVYDAGPTGAVIPNASVNIIGFLQVFIDSAFQGGGPNAGSFDITIVNVAGCGSNATGTPVFPGSSSAVPVRLIHQ